MPTGFVEECQDTGYWLNCKNSHESIINWSILTIRESCTGKDSNKMGRFGL